MKRRDVSLILAAWILSVGIDFLLHGGLLARLYVRESEFLLPAGEAFARIPLGYLSFLGLAAAVWWLARDRGVQGWRGGFRLGLVTGGVAWGLFLMGLFSISTAEADLLLGWWVGQSIELAAAGAVIGAGLGPGNRRPIYLTVGALVFACVVLTVVLQAVGWAPAMAIAGAP